MAARVTIRPYRPGDGIVLRDVYIAGVLGTARQFYDGPQVEAWAARARTPDQYELKAADGRLLLVALGAGNRPVAYGELEADGHIDHVYCHPGATGQGVASALYDALERIARARGTLRLFVEASEAARPLFEHKGFVIVARNDLELGGVPIHNWRMEKRLAP